MFLNDPLRDGETETKPFVLSRRVERIKDLRKILFRNPDSRVGNLQANLFGAVIPGFGDPDLDSALSGYGLNGIQDQIDDELLNLIVVPFAEYRFVRESSVDPDSFLAKLLLAER